MTSADRTPRQRILDLLGSRVMTARQLAAGGSIGSGLAIERIITTSEANVSPRKGLMCECKTCP